MASDEAITRHEAIDALRGGAQAQQELARRVTAPWWYKLGTALSTLAIFVGIGLFQGIPVLGTHETVGNAVVVVGAIIGPAVLLTALKNTIGVATDRYGDGLGWWYAIVFGLLALAFVLEMSAGVSVAFPVAGAVAFVVTLLTERHIDTVLRRRIAAPASAEHRR